MFRLEAFDPLNVPNLGVVTRSALEDLVVDVPDTAALSRLRNLLAHLCFGTDEFGGHTGDPLATDTSQPLLSGYGTVDYLRSLDIVTGCDVPLALIYWSGNGLEIVDCWAVRRRPMPAPTSSNWPSLDGNRMRIENEARLFQFQEHITWLLNAEAAPSLIEAHEYFRFLPAAGLLPLSTGTRAGFDGATFFDAVPMRETIEFINGEQLRSIIDISWNHEPVDLAENEMVWAYLPWQQQQAQADGATDRAYLVFTSAHIPPMNIPRFDVARWDYSNYARDCSASNEQGD